MKQQKHLLARSIVTCYIISSLIIQDVCTYNTKYGGLYGHQENEPFHKLTGVRDVLLETVQLEGGKYWGVVAGHDVIGAAV